MTALRRAPALALAAALSLTAYAGPAFIRLAPEGIPMSHATAAPAPLQPMDPDVVDKLIEYDRTRAPVLLKEAADAAALHDRQAPPDPALALTLARNRVAGWLAIVARFRRDLDPDFDPNRIPPLHVSPPRTASGAQLPPGVRPSDVKDPEARKAYIEAIEKNRERLARFGQDSELFRARAVVLERAASSIADAHATLGLPVEEITAMIAAADIGADDRKALLAAL